MPKNKEKWIRGWKVIMRNTRESCTSNHQIVKYNKNTIVRRPKDCGPLAVFKTRKAARDFLLLSFYTFNRPKKHKSRKIVKCIYIKSKHGYLWSWSNSINIQCCNMPSGTDFAEKVKCLE